MTTRDRDRRYAGAVAPQRGQRPCGHPHRAYRVVAVHTSDHMPGNHAMCTLASDRWRHRCEVVRWAFSCRITAYPSSDTPTNLRS
jgi:hypothetical protein